MSNALRICGFLRAVVCQLRWPVTVRQFLSVCYDGPVLWPVTVCQLRWIVISLGTDVGYVGQIAGCD